MSVKNSYCFANRLKVARELRRLTQDQLSAKLGISRKSLIRYESGESYPKESTLRALADVLDISIDWLASPIEISDDKIVKAGGIERAINELYLSEGKDGSVKLGNEGLPLHGFEGLFSFFLYHALLNESRKNGNSLLDEVNNRLWESFNSENAETDSEILRRIADQLEKKLINI